MALRYFAHRNIIVLVSQSKDGELFARICTSLGYQVIRGSSSKGAVAGLYQVLKRAKENPGLSLGMALDGPRGPALVKKHGPDFMGQHLKLPLMQPSFEIKHSCFFTRFLGKPFLKLKSWDKLRVPLPFARVGLRYMRPLKETGHVN